MAAGFTLTDNTQAPQNGFFTTITFSTVTFNTGAGDIPIVMFYLDTASTTVPTITINGAGTTVYSTGLISSEFVVGFAYGTPGVLTTAPVVLTLSGSVSAGITIQAGRVTGAATSPFNQQNSGGFVSSPAAMTVNVPVSGVGISAVCSFFHGSATISFSGSTNDPNGDGSISNALGNTNIVATAHTLTAGTPQTITSTISDASTPIWAMISFSQGGAVSSSNLTGMASAEW